MSHSLMAKRAVKHMDLSLLVVTLDLQGRKMHFTQACDWKNVPYLHNINGLLLLKVIGSRKD